MSMEKRNQSASALDISNYSNNSGGHCTSTSTPTLAHTLTNTPISKSKPPLSLAQPSKKPNKQFTYHINIDMDTYTQPDKVFSLFTILSKYINQLDITQSKPSEYFDFYIKISEKLLINQSKLRQISTIIPLPQLYYLAYTDSRSLSRIYLLSIIGSLFPMTQPDTITKILHELLIFLSKTVHSITAFFARYFTFTVFKDSFSKLNSNVAVTFLLSNLIEMNNLLITIANDHPNNKDETQLLTCLIEQNINLLFSLKNMTGEIYRTHILSSLISLVYNTESKAYQEYIINWIISGLFEEYILLSLEPLLNIIIPLYSEIDPNIPKKVKRILDRLLSYFKCNSSPNKKFIEDISPRYRFIFENLENILLKASKLIDTRQFIELVESYVNFTLFASPKELKAKILNMIFNDLNSHFSQYRKCNEGQLIPNDAIKIYERICGSVFKSGDVKIFDVEILISLTDQFDPETAVKANRNILKGIVKNKIEINSSEKMNIVIEVYSKVLGYKCNSLNLNGNGNGNKVNGSVRTDNCNRNGVKGIDVDVDTEGEQKTIIQIMGLIQNSNPEKQLEMFLMMKNIYEKKYSAITKLSLPSFFNTLLNLIKKCEVAYIKQQTINQQSISNSNSNSIESIDFNANTNTITMSNSNANNNCNGLDLSDYDEDKFVNLLIIIYTFIKDSFLSTFMCYPETNLNFIPSIIMQIETLRVARDKFTETCYSFIRTFISILIKDITDNALKLRQMTELITLVSHLTIIPKKQYEKVVYNITQAARSFQKRTDTTVLSITICDLYYNTVLTDHAKILESFEFAKREAEFCLAKIENLHLFIVILNKVLFYVDKGETFIPVEFATGIIDIINCNVDILVSEYPDIGKKIEGDYIKIKKHIDEMKDKRTIKFYMELSY